MSSGSDQEISRGYERGVQFRKQKKAVTTKRTERREHNSLKNPKGPLEKKRGLRSTKIFEGGAGLSYPMSGPKLLLGGFQKKGPQVPG